MTDLNLVVFSGRVVKTPELKKNGDLSILEFSVAINRSVKVKDKEEWSTQTSFILLTVFGQKAEKLESKLEKGKIVQIQGRLCQDIWEKDGKKLSQLKVIPEKIQVIPGQKSVNDTKESQPNENDNISINNGWKPVDNNNSSVELNDIDNLEIY